MTAFVSMVRCFFLHGWWKISWTSPWICYFCLCKLIYVVVFYVIVFHVSCINGVIKKTIGVISENLLPVPGSVWPLLILCPFILCHNVQVFQLWCTFAILLCKIKSDIFMCADWKCGMSRSQHRCWVSTALMGESWYPVSLSSHISC